MGVWFVFNPKCIAKTLHQMRRITLPMFDELSSIVSLDDFWEVAEIE